MRRSADLDDVLWLTGQKVALYVLKDPEQRAWGESHNDRIDRLVHTIAVGEVVHGVAEKAT